MGLWLLIVLLPVAVGYCSTVVSVTPIWAQALPDVTELLRHVTAAAGGVDAAQRVTSRVSKGFVVTPGGRAPMTVYQKMPDRFLTVIDSPVGGLSRNAFDGTGAWSENRNGIQIKAGLDVGFVRREQTLHREIRLGTLFKTLTVEPEIEVGGRPAIGVGAIADDGTTERFFFDRESYLLVRHEVEVNRTLLRSEFEDYRTVDGLPVAYRVKRSRPDFAWTTELVEVRQNVPIEDSVFVRPPGR